MSESETRYIKCSSVVFPSFTPLISFFAAFETPYPTSKRRNRCRATDQMSLSLPWPPNRASLKRDWLWPRTHTGTSQLSLESSLTDMRRGLRMRHVQLIAISGSIGAALFVSIGNPLTSAGPLGLLIGVLLWSFVVFCASNCLIEMTTLLPLDGGFISFAERFVDKSFAMALGWNVCPLARHLDTANDVQYIITQWALICFELVAINIIVEYWKPLHPAILISVCLVAIGALNLWSVRWFGEAEFWISITKIFLIFGLIMYTFVTMLGA